MSKFPLPTEADIAAKNKELRFDIPKEYASFLMHTNGGGISDKNTFLIRENGKVITFFEVSCFFGIDINHEDLFYDLFNQYLSLLEEMPKGFLPIALDGVSNLLALGVQGDNYGKVYMFTETDDPRWEPYMRYPPDLLCGNFNEFLSALTDKHTDE